MKHLHFTVSLIALLCFPLVVLPFEQMEINRNALKPVSHSVQTIINSIYSQHNLTEETSRLRFVVYDNEKMLPESAISAVKPNITSCRYNSTTVTILHGLLGKDEFIILSPGRHKAIEIDSPKFTSSTVFDLLLALELRNLNVHPELLSNQNQEKTDLEWAVKKGAIKKMHTRLLTVFSDDLNYRSSNIEQSAYYKALLNLITQELESRKTILVD